MLSDLRRARLEKGLTQRQVGVMAKLSQTYVSNAERGMVGPPEKMAKLHQVLGLESNAGHSKGGEAGDTQ
jgi:transcriptional regulator with XRE-family HTH domain